MIENYDNDGKLHNSVPIQFTAGKLLPAEYLPVEENISEENISFECEKIPTLKNIINIQAINFQESVTSENGSDGQVLIDKGIDIYPGGEANFEIFYEGENGILRFHFEGPSGFSCKKVTADINIEKLQCHWVPIYPDEWHLEETNFCFAAIGRVFLRFSS